MLYQCIFYQAIQSCTTISGSDISLLGDLSMQTSTMYRYRRYAKYTRVIHMSFTTDSMICQTPTIHTMRIKRLGHLVAGLFQAKSIAYIFRFVSSQCLKLPTLLYFIIEPLFAHFKWAERLIPFMGMLNSFCLNIFHTDVCNRI